MGVFYASTIVNRHQFSQKNEGHHPSFHQTIQRLLYRQRRVLLVSSTICQDDIDAVFADYSRLNIELIYTRLIVPCE